MLEPVLRRPEVSLSSQRWRSGAIGGATGISIGCTSALPIRLPPCAGAGGGCTTGAAAGAGAGAGFFLKKLNIAALFRITGFYETPLALLSLYFFLTAAAFVRTPGGGANAAQSRTVQARQWPHADRAARSPGPHRRAHAVGARGRHG